MRRLIPFIAAPLLTCGSFAQTAAPIKSYKTQEDYCRENPQMPTCIKGKPLGDIGAGIIYKPPVTPAAPAGTARRTARPQAPEVNSLTAVKLEDWRFSHPSPAMLISINIGSLLRSPVWATLFAAGAGSAQWKPADLEKARTALSEIGQMLISVSPNGTANPSVLMLARGNVDGAFGAMLRSGSGAQAKRLDAITLLIGDAQSLEFANLRIRGAAGRTTWNPLQQAATREALKYDAWIGIDPRHLASMASAFGGGSNPAPGMLANLRGFSLGVYLRDQIRAEAALDAPSAEMAERMLAAYQQIQAKQPAGKDPLGGHVWVATEGAKLRFIKIIEASRLNQVPGLDAATAQMIGPHIAPLIQALAGLGSSAQAQTAAPPKPAQRAIVIQGLEGGPKELPTK